MNLNKLLICSLIFVVSLTIGCNENPVIKIEAPSETNDCAITSPDADTPLNFIAKAINSNKVLLSWNPVRPYSTTYRVYKGSTLIATTNYTSYEDNFNLDENIEYEYYIYSEATLKKSVISSTAIHKGYLSSTNVQDVYTVAPPYDCLIYLSLEKDYALDLSATNGIEIYGTSTSELIYNGRGPNRFSNAGGASLIAKAGSYTVKLNRTNGKGNFTWVSSTVRSQYANDTEPNDLKENSILVQPNAVIQGHIGYKGETQSSSDDVDFYRIDIPSNKSYTFAIDKTQETFLLSYIVCHVDIFKSDGVTVLDYNFNNGSSFTNEISLTTGTYYIKISRTSGHGGYQFKMCSK